MDKWRRCDKCGQHMKNCAGFICESEEGKLAATAMRRMGFFLTPGRNEKYDKKLNEEIRKLKRAKNAAK